MQPLIGSSTVLPFLCTIIFFVKFVLRKLSDIGLLPFSLLSIIDAIVNFSGSDRIVSGANATAEIWATYNQDFVSIGTGFLDQVGLVY